MSDLEIPLDIDFNLHFSFNKHCDFHDSGNHHNDQEAVYEIRDGNGASRATFYILRRGRKFWLGLIDDPQRPYMNLCTADETIAKLKLPGSAPRAPDDQYLLGPMPEVDAAKIIKLTGAGIAGAQSAVKTEWTDDLKRYWNPENRLSITSELVEKSQNVRWIKPKHKLQLD